ncbi:MAG: HlyC/CorC family transporter [Proteobacteria bacterium]|nr:HlyC/CorC family transporter [Pseudomonadota bacterium]
MDIIPNKITTWIKNLFLKKDSEHLEKEIQSIIDAGEIDQRSGEMIQSILDFRDTQVREVMVPRTEMIAIESDASVEEILDLIMRYGHTRMPVYRGSVDNIIGILNVKDLLKFWSKQVSESDILSSLRKPYYIPETKNIHFLLHELQQRKYHIAIVIDEYGGTSGLVTLEDLIEEIVGEIYDEHDVKEEEIVELPDGYTLVDSRMEVEEVEEYFGMEIPEGKFETLGGLILHIVEKIPVAGEVIYYDDFEMIIESADERNIKKVKIKKVGEDSKESKE